MAKELELIRIRLSFRLLAPSFLPSCFTINSQVNYRLMKMKKRSRNMRRKYTKQMLNKKSVLLKRTKGQSK